MNDHEGKKVFENKDQGETSLRLAAIPAGGARHVTGDIMDTSVQIAATWMTQPTSYGTDTRAILAEPCPTNPQKHEK